MEQQIKEPAPAPFAQSEQYKKAFKKDPPQPDPEVAEKPAPKTTLKPGKKKKQRPELKNVPKDEAVAGASNGLGGYKAHEYSGLRKDFIAKAKEAGATHAEASGQWDSSEQKRLLLCHMSVGELKRRRFITKEETTNPFLKADT